MILTTYNTWDDPPSRKGYYKLQTVLFLKKEQSPSVFEEFLGKVFGARGEPHWDMIFGYLLQHFGHIRLFQTAFVLVDNRDLIPCHSMNLVEDFDYKRPCLLTWARACFEQGSLPSMLHLGGSALLGVLPGDKMFQAQRLNPRFTRPAILHGYGGAKRDIPHTLPGLAIFFFFFSLLPLLLASGTMGIVMAIAPLWVKRQKWMTQSSRKHCVSQW